MKNKKLSFLFVLLLGAVTTISGQTGSMSLDIIKWTGESKNVELKSIHKITFSENDLIVNYESEDAESVDMLSIRKLVFKETNSTGIISPENREDKISISMNPGDNRIFLNNLPEGKHLVKIYSTTGSLTHNEEVTQGSSINVNNLKSGVYVVTVNNQAIKFVRQ